MKRPFGRSPGDLDPGIPTAQEVGTARRRIASTMRTKIKDVGELPWTLDDGIVVTLRDHNGECVCTLSRSHKSRLANARLILEAKRLDGAWASAKTNVLSLVAEGGAGKSALVNEWLKRLQADNYRGAEAVLGWSFYSQGTKERATSTDEFLNWALARLGITLATTSATAKSEAIAEAMMRRRVLLLLDGVEPLQHGLGPRLGQLKDFGLRALLRRFVATAPGDAHGLVVLTSRLAVKDIARWQDGAAPVIDVERLSDEAGAALLRDNGVWGTDKVLKAAAHDFGGHPLALGLLASFLKETQTGDARRRDHIRSVLPILIIQAMTMPDG
jgi:hypothetical protein